MIVVACVLFLGFCTVTQGSIIPIDITEFVEFKIGTPSGTYFTALEEGRWMLKLSETQYNAAIAQNLLNDTANADNIRTKFNCNYSPDGNPNRYWLCMEDHGPDEDYKDVMTRVTDNRDGTVTLECISGFTYHNNTIMDKVTGREIFPIGCNCRTFSAARTATLVVGSVDLSCGNVGNLLVYASSTVVFHAREFQFGEGLSLDGDRVLGTGILSGEWFDGTPWSVNIVINDATATILAIPEPATMGLVALGGLGMLMRRRIARR